jgi:hypothetical protein
VVHLAFDLIFTCGSHCEASLPDNLVDKRHTARIGVWLTAQAVEGKKAKRMNIWNSLEGLEE